MPLIRRQTHQDLDPRRSPMRNTISSATSPESLGLTQTPHASVSPGLPQQSRRWQWIVRIAGLVIIACFCWFLYTRRVRFVQVIDIGLCQIALMSSAFLVIWILNVLREQVLYRSLSARVPTVPLFVISLSSLLLNYLPLQAGTLAKANILKRLFRLRYAQFLVVWTIYNMVIVFATGLAGLTITLLTLPRSTGGWTVLVGCFGACVVGPLVALAVKGRRFSDRWYAGRVLNDIGEGWNVMRKCPGALGSVVALNLLAIAVGSLRLMVAFTCIGVVIRWDAALILASVLQLGIFLGFTPGALGLREGLIGATAGLLGLSLETGIFAATIDRAVAMALNITFGIPATMWTSAKIRAAK